MVENPYIEGTPEKPSRARYHWETEHATPVGKALDGGEELFLLVQRASGSFEEKDDLEDYQTVFVPRPAHWPSVQKITMKYLDKAGSLQDLRNYDQNR